MLNVRKTKILCTLGPVSEDPEVIRKLVEAGMNAVRLNTSHGSLQEHRRNIRMIKSIREELSVSLPIVLDLEGPKIRVEGLENPIHVDQGEEIYLFKERKDGIRKGFRTSYPKLVEELEIGDRILVDDGKIGFEVVNKREGFLILRAENSGEVKPRKGVNVPGVDISLPALSEKDRDFIALAVEEKVEFVAQSFVRKPSDVLELKKLIVELKGSQEIIAKIETAQALENLEDIVKNADAVMVARGDLGVEIPTEMVPIEQKRIIQLANRYTKPVITATQMLESMIDSPVPTRAEATDIANSILDGTDVMMLSGETAVGKYPIEAVKVMDKIAKEVEKRFEDFRGYQIGWLREFPVVSDKSEAIAHSCWDISETLNLNLIVTPTTTGGTAKRVSKYRPRAVIIGIASDEFTFHKLGLVWGVVPLLMRKTVSTDKMFDDISELLLEKNIAEKGETIVITAGIPWGISGTTNLIKIHTL